MKKLFLATSLVLMLFVSYAPLASAAGGTFFGPIVPDGSNGQPDCNCLAVKSPNTGEMIPSAPDWGCIMQTVQNTVNFAITLGMMIAILYIVYSGFLFVMSAGNPSSREAAKTRITNVVIGLVVMLGAWLVIDFVMKRLYGESGLYGPWNAILTEDGKPHCLQVAKPPKALPGIVGQAPPGPSTTGQTGTGALTFQTPEIANQSGYASAELYVLMTCIAANVPANVAQISSISEKDIANGSKTMSYCAANGQPECEHTVNSCHYGGRTCVGKSYAVDYGDENNASVIIQAANTCGAKAAAVHNGNHVHVTVQSNCGCT